MRTSFENKQQIIGVPYYETKQETFYQIVECPEFTKSVGTVVYICKCDNDALGIIFHKNEAEKRWVYLTKDSHGFNSMKFAEIKHGSIKIEW